MNAAATATALDAPARAAAAGCPFHAAAPAGLRRDDVLLFPLNRRTVVQYLTDPDGTRELVLLHGAKEVSFDEPELFAFGETLARQARFAAGDALRWGDGYAWERVAPLLEQLVDEGVLERADAADASAVASLHDAAGERASPLPPAEATEPHDWDDCAAITERLTGRALDPGHLELVIPVFRVAHMALDADGRQVGEANVFPKALRLDVPTRWRTCIYDGSRHLDAKPMNVSALKAMRTHWSAVMAALQAIRAAYLRRFPAARDRMTLGDVECLSTLVLAVATWPLLRAERRVANGALHPALSSMFRVTDGLRMTSHQMLFVPTGEPTLDPGTVVDGAAIHAYAERNQSFHSTHGVCAGPQAMIDEFLGVLVDGRALRDAAPARLDAGLQDALDDVDAAFEYGLLGLQAHAVVFALWPVMTRAYAQLGAIVDAWPDAPTPAVDALRAHLHGRLEILRNATLHATEEWRVNRERVYAHIVAHCDRGLGAPAARALPALIEARKSADADALRTRIAAIVRRRLGAGRESAAGIERIAGCLAAYLVQAQAIVGLASDVQARINARLGRAAPARPFDAADIDIHVLLAGSESRRLPHLIDALEPMLGLRATVTQDRIEIDDRSEADAAAPVDPICRHGAGE